MPIYTPEQIADIVCQKPERITAGVEKAHPDRSWAQAFYELKQLGFPGKNIEILQQGCSKTIMAVFAALVEQHAEAEGQAQVTYNGNPDYPLGIKFESELPFLQIRDVFDELAHRVILNQLRLTKTNIPYLLTVPDSSPPEPSLRA